MVALHACPVSMQYPSCLKDPRTRKGQGGGRSGDIGKRLSLCFCHLLLADLATSSNRNVVCMLADVEQSSFEHIQIAPLQQTPFGSVTTFASIHSVGERGFPLTCPVCKKIKAQGEAVEFLLGWEEVVGRCQMWGTPYFDVSFSLPLRASASPHLFNGLILTTWMNKAGKPTC